MTRLIDANGLFDKVGKIKPRSKEHYKSIGEFMNLITNSPTIDAVEVVRCKNCKWSDWYKTLNGEHRCYCMEHGSRGHTDDDYCSYGEREDGEEHEKADRCE